MNKRIAVVARPYDRVMKKLLSIQNMYGRKNEEAEMDEMGN